MAEPAAATQRERRQTQNTTRAHPTTTTARPGHHAQPKWSASATAAATVRSGPDEAEQPAHQARREWSSWMTRTVIMVDVVAGRYDSPAVRYDSLSITYDSRSHGTGANQPRMPLTPCRVKTEQRKQPPACQPTPSHGRARQRTQPACARPCPVERRGGQGQTSPSTRLGSTNPATRRAKLNSERNPACQTGRLPGRDRAAESTTLANPSHF